MRIVIKKLVATGPTKRTASVDFDSKSHLVVGPTDTGKSYIVQCIRYCLGSSRRPEDIGYSTGYSLLCLQLAAGDNAQEITIFRDLTEGDSLAFSGLHEVPPQSSGLECEGAVDDLLIKFSSAANRRLLTKPGTLSNLTVDSLRHIAIFDEIETLDTVPLEGKDKLLKMRNRSAISLVLSGADDSTAVLVPTAQKRSIAKGHVEALEIERDSIIKTLPESLTKKDAEDALGKVSNELDILSSFISDNAQQLNELKRAQAKLEDSLSASRGNVVSLTEALERFRLLDRKYTSDSQRLSAIAQAAGIVGHMKSRPCPLCLTDLSHQARHNTNIDVDGLVQAAASEVEKIRVLQRELQLAIDDLGSDLTKEREQVAAATKSINEIRVAQASLLQPRAIANRNELVTFADRKAELSMAIREFERIDSLQARISIAKGKSKRQPQGISRDLAESVNKICRRVQELLDVWQVPGVEAVSYDEAAADIRINERRRVSFGKGKRAIFLTAYVVAVMERALDIGAPHLGVVVIDSPVVTYRDPKHGNDVGEELLDPSVKDCFYSWLVARENRGQIIILENEEPDIAVRQVLRITEFVGLGGALGRKGFYPI